MTAVHSKFHINELYKDLSCRGHSYTSKLRKESMLSFGIRVNIAHDFKTGLVVF